MDRRKATEGARLAGVVYRPCIDHVACSPIPDRDVSRQCNRLGRLSEWDFAREFGGRDSFVRALGLRLVLYRRDRVSTLDTTANVG